MLPKKTLPGGRYLLALSIILQLVLGFFLGHAYDMRIFMATGYLVGTGQNPYIPQDLSLVFHDSSFAGITTVGYPPPWPLVSGLIYLVTYKFIPNLLLYNLALKIPIILANVCLAFLIARILAKLRVDEKGIRKAWLFMLFNPFLLYVSCAWGQIDPIVAVLSMLALVLLSEGKMAGSAILLALAVAFKPTALPIVPAVFVFLTGKPFRLVFKYFVLFTVCAVLLFVGPFAILGWSPSPILQHWNAQFSVGGGMSFMTFLELVDNSYELYGPLGFLGFLWVPALGMAAYALRPGGEGLIDLLVKSTALTLVFFLFRTWLSEPNLVLVIAMLLVLTSVGRLEARNLTAVWVIALIYSFLNTSTFQLLFPSMPGLMERLLQASDHFRTARLVLRTLSVIPWLVTGGRIVKKFIKEDRRAVGLIKV
jgi:hypothetical protein